jgi:hypothetical protein
MDDPRLEMLSGNILAGLREVIGKAVAAEYSHVANS